MARVMGVVSGVLSAYMVLIFIRILLTWFRSGGMEGPIRFLGKITDPYLNFFRRFSFLRTDRIDFSPIFAIVVLVIVLNVVNSLAITGSITLGLVLAYAVGAIWSAFSFLLFFFFTIVAVRLVAILIKPQSEHPFWRTLDVISQSLVSWVTRTVVKRRIVHYRTQLLLTLGALFLTFLVTRIVTGGLIGLFRSLPI